jgi:2,4-dienoyl-CoA reductase-like NADH-dependent reductase (Old Yellow Enzyme family)
MPGRPGGRQPRALSIAEIGDVIGQYVAAIGRAKAAGFDGVELHGAHGYLLAAFLAPGGNRRTDEFGGSPARRAEIVRRIVGAARKAVGPDYPIQIKVNCDDQGEGASAIGAFTAMAQELEKAGVSAIDCSGRNPIRPQIDSPEKESYFLPYAERAGVRVPVLLTGGNRSIVELGKIFQKGRIQFFGFARPLLREPDLPKRWQEGRGGAAATCISCNECLKTLPKGTHCVRA